MCVEDGERVRGGDWERDGGTLTWCRIRQPRSVPAIVECCARVLGKNEKEKKQV